MQWFVFRAMAFLLLSALGKGQLTNCQKYLRMTPTPRSMEVHCNCMQKLVDMSDPLYKLTINQTGCEDRVLQLDWSTLQTYVGVEVLVFDNAMVTFTGERSPMSNCSVTEVIFLNSKIKEIPRDAFYGLHKLQKIRFLDTEIIEIRSKSFHAFRSLQTIEFSNTSIGRIESNAFSQLPDLYEFGFIYSRIGTIESNSLQLSRPISTQKCPLKARMAFPFMHDIMSRDLSSAANITLPDYGPRVFIFKSNISTIESRSLSADGFSYIIIGGNQIRNLESRAFDAELHNRCDISALLLIGNLFRKVGSEFMAGVTGDEANLMMATVALSDNVFEKISHRAFLLNDSLNIYTIEDNTIGCTCGNFHWLLSNEHSETQKTLERELIEKSVCLDEVPLANYLTAYQEKCPAGSTPKTQDVTISSMAFSSSSKVISNICLLLIALLCFPKMK